MRIINTRALQRTIATWSRKASFFPLLVCRITLGWLFIVSGWLKIHDLANLTQFFTDLGIPAAAFNARLVAWSELLCGGLILIGLASRLASIPLVVTMVVALITAKRAEINGLNDLFYQVEFTYVCMLIVIIVLGPGAVSVDSRISRSSHVRAKAAKDEGGKPVLAT